MKEEGRWDPCVPMSPDRRLCRIWQTLHRHAIEVIARLEELAQAVDDCQSGATGHLRLCANPSAFGGFLPGVLAEYAQRYPKVIIDLEDALSEDGIRAVQKGSAEIAVIGDNVPCEGLETIVCNVDKLVLLVPEGHPLDSRSDVALEKIFDENFVTLARSASLTRKVMAAAESVGRAPRIRVQVRSFDSMCRMVASGIGIAILPRAAATLYAQALKLAMMDIQDIDTERILLVAMRHRAELSPAAAALVDMLQRKDDSGVRP